ncbi:MAG: DNA-protecting protein DprA [Candidatus Brocadiae bacterium]|nr:DNA-protecting protein DprA [Candidatus Brocadiia bacterium]
MADDLLRDLVALNLTLRLDAADYHRLIDAFGSHEALRQASARDLLERGGLSQTLARQVVRTRESSDPDEEIRQAAERDVAILHCLHPHYPASLRRTPRPPLVLYVRGALEPTDAVAVAIVGSRQPTHYGATQAARLAAELAARGITVVSGLARGIDSAAHQGALDSGGRTLAVLGSGLADLYPQENTALAQAVADHGAVLSEFPLHTPAWPANFPRRNRIVSGLALGVLVVEAATKSGALVTADCALAQGREVMAVPGRVDRRQSHGCHWLLKQGARLVEGANDVLDALGDVALALAPPRPKAPRAPIELPPEHAAVLAAVADEPTHIDTITAACGLPAHAVAGALVCLELKKLVSQLPGKHFVTTTPT